MRAFATLLPLLSPHDLLLCVYACIHALLLNSQLKKQKEQLEQEKRPGVEDELVLLETEIREARSAEGEDEVRPVDWLFVLFVDWFFV